MMKFFKCFFCALLLVFSGAAMAGKSGSGSTRSMSRGFSSYRAPSVASKPRTSMPSSFGSFGSNNSGAKPSSIYRSDSATSRDLGNSQAQGNAMKNWDSRHPSIPRSSPSINTGNNGSAIGTQATSHPQIPNSPVIVQHQGSNMGSVLTGVLIGQAISRPHNSNGNGATTNNNSQLEPITADGEFKQGAITGDANAEPSPAEHASVTPNAHVTQVSEENGMSAMGWIFMLGVIGGVVWLVRRKLQRLGQMQANPANSVRYSLGKQ